MPEYEKDTLYRPETKKSGSLAYKIGQAIAILMSLCASAIIYYAHRNVRKDRSHHCCGYLSNGQLHSVTCCSDG